MINELLLKIKKNKKYKTISDIIVKREIENYLKSNANTKSDKKIIKDIRAKLHRIYSSYQTNKKSKIKDYLESLKLAIKNKEKIKEITNSLLQVSLSTNERIQDYETVYKNIFLITGQPKTIVDLGSGLNVFSFPLMNLQSLTYLSYDIDEKDIEFLNEYYGIMKQSGLNGKAEFLDLKDLKFIDAIPKSDIVFMFKLIDLIEEFSEKIIKEIFLKNKAKFIVASFATRTLTRRSMNLPIRRGFELMLERNNLKFERFSTINEVFYVIRT